MTRSGITLVLTLLLATTLAACGGTASGAGAGDKVTLTLVAYSTPREAYEQIIKAYQQTPAGKNITFQTSYGGSGEQSRAVEAGLEADLVAFSLEPDMTRLVTAKLVDPAWNATPTRGMVTDSVVVLVVRAGNPKNIHGWADLTKPGIEVITPDPLTSGGAKWNIMAGYGAQLKQQRTPAQGEDYLRALMANVVVQDKSARESLQTFIGGKGDVMLAYENEAIFAQKQGEKLEYIVPAQTILIENPVAVVTESKHPEQAKAFLSYLQGAEAQAIFAANGYRPVLAEAGAKANYPQPSGLFSIADLGGWSEVNKHFFDPTNGLIAEIERQNGGR